MTDDTELTPEELRAVTEGWLGLVKGIIEVMKGSALPEELTKLGYEVNELPGAYDFTRTPRRLPHGGMVCQSDKRDGLFRR